MRVHALPVECGSLRARRHQLAFELVTAGTLAMATRQWALVGLAGAVCLPAVRATWAGWIRSGVGLIPFGVAALIISSAGHEAVAWLWLAACAVGIARQQHRAYLLTSHRTLGGDAADEQEASRGRGRGPDRSR